jgi:hypothetical protein
MRASFIGVRFRGAKRPRVSIQLFSQEQIIYACMLHWNVFVYGG